LFSCRFIYEYEVFFFFFFFFFFFRFTRELTVFDALYACPQYYGVPRLYRRAMELNRLVISNPVRRQQVRNATQLAFRLPGQMLDRIRRRPPPAA
jgi:hypothetical protein